MRLKIVIATAISVVLIQMAYAQKQPLYKNSSASSHERTLDLLSRMTLEEKVGQLLCPLGWEMYDKQGKNVVASPKFEKAVQEDKIGMLWATYRADPWTRKTLANGLDPMSAAKAGNALQRYVMEHTRLGIPVFLAEECPHGHMAIGTTVFPTGIGLAASWSPELLKSVGQTISKELRLQGGHIAYGPILDLAREPRWSRVEETFGEDQVLTGMLGDAMLQGMGGGNLANPNSAIATLKHFIAYGVPQGGRNGGPVELGERELKEKFLPPFRSAVTNGALSVMTSYNSVDGVPCTANEELLKGVLHNDWHFRGFTVSDLTSIEGLSVNHHVARTIEDAACLALKSGVDVDLGGNAYKMLINAVKAGKMQMADIDSAAYRVLKLKFEMGLFEHPYVDPALASKQVRTAESVNLARNAAQKSIVLLKNYVLPLDKKIGKVALIGPNADNRYNMLGDYTAPQEDNNVKTVLDGLKSILHPDQVEYVKGCAIRDTMHTEIDKAVEAAKRADVVVAVVGGSSARDFKTHYLETGAAIASEQTVSDMESGEGFDRSTLNLLGKQLDLLKALKATGKPLVVIYIEGRPLNMNWAAENADALLTAWYPGQEGGNAIADVLFGDYNPAGRLPVSVPRSEGQLPVYYNQKVPAGHNYVEGTNKPLYSFGYGLSYTTFVYGNMEVKKSGGDNFEATVSVKNTGNCDGEEVVQLYAKHEVASTVQPMLQLKSFQRIFLKKGESRQVKFILKKDDFTIVDRKMNYVVEPGQVTLMVGAASDDIRLNANIMIE